MNVRTQVWSGISIDVHTIIGINNENRQDDNNKCFYYRKVSKWFFSFYLYMVFIRHVRTGADRSGPTYIVPIDNWINIYILLFTLESDRPYSNLGKLIVSIVKSAVFVVGTFVFVNVHP